MQTDRSIAIVVGFAAAVVALAALAGCDQGESSAGRSPDTSGLTRADADSPKKHADSHRPPQVDFTDVDPAVVRAIELAQDAARKSPDSASAWGTLAMTLLAHEFEEAAAIAFEQAAACDPTDARWPYLQARSIQATDPDGAVPLLRAATEICHNKPDAPLLRLVEVLFELDRIEEAEQQLALFLADTMTNARARLIAGRIAFRKGNLQEALDHLRVAKLHKCGRRQAAQLMAKAYLRLGERSMADLLSKEAAKAPELGWLDPYWAETMKLRTGVKDLLVRADIAFGNGKVNEAVALLEKARADYPDSLWARIHLGRALIQLRQLPEAENVLQEALQLSPQSVEAQFRMGVICFLQDRREDAADCYRQAIRQKPDFAMAHYNLGYCLKELGDVEGAIGAFQRTIECEPDYFDARAFLGDLLAQKGRHDEARDHFRWALRLQPGSSWVKQRLDQLPTE